jgi:hypothetical protein
MTAAEWLDPGESIDRSTSASGAQFIDSEEHRWFKFVADVPAPSA